MTRIQALEILSIVRQSTDVDVIQESAGYVHWQLDESDMPEENPVATPFNQARGLIPDVIPISTNGSVDVDLTKMTTSELIV